MSSNPRPKLKNITPLKRATADTLFYIDYDWWEKSDLDLKTYIFNRLDIGDGEMDTNTDEVDLVSPDTGEVRRVDGFQYVVQTYFSQLPDDFIAKGSLVDAVFCTILANANQPMSAKQIAERINRTPDVVLKTIGGPKIYQGIRPVQ